MMRKNIYTCQRHNQPFEEYVSILQNGEFLIMVVDKATRRFSANTLCDLLNQLDELSNTIIPADNLLATLYANVNNEKLSDKDFRDFMRNCEPLLHKKNNG
jgi:Zn-dependent M16 (insulinase) family peptidase